MQRVSSASVTVDEAEVSAIGEGILVLLAVRKDDVDGDAVKLADRIGNLRIFSDAEGKMNRSAVEVDAEALVVSQFTLYGATSKGRRPSFVEAARPEIAQPLIDLFCLEMSGLGIRTSSGRFRAHMAVRSVNDGPVTLIVEVGRKTDG